MFSKMIFFLIAISLLSCGRKIDIQKIAVDKNLDTIPDAGIAALASKKIFFGHMSVGSNILQGMENIIEADDRFREIKIFELSPDDEAVDAPGIYHAKNGKNGFAKTKCNAFIKFLGEKNRGEKFDIAFFKFCYVDIDRDNDINNLFNYYVQTIDQVKQEFPRLRIVHFTIPLAVHSWGLKRFVKNILFGDIENFKRNQFNEMLKNEFQDKDTIFDLATIESTLPDGTRSSFSYKDNTYFSLARQYTNDGGHLNEIGRFCAAKELLTVLAQLSLRDVN